MEATIFSDRKSGHNIDFIENLSEEHNATKQNLIEIKHEISDLRKDFKFEISQLKTMNEHNVEQSYKDLEMRMYHFMTKAIITAVGVLGGLQSFFHFMK